MRAGLTPKWVIPLGRLHRLAPVHPRRRLERPGRQRLQMLCVLARHEKRFLTDTGIEKSKKLAVEYQSLAF